MRVVVLANKSIVVAVQYITVTLVSWRRQVYLEIRYLFNVSSCSPIRIGCESCSPSGYQPAVYMANELQSEIAWELPTRSIRGLPLRR